jgi:hypothetical protein
MRSKSAFSAAANPLQQIGVATACDRVMAHNCRALRRRREVPKRCDVRSGFTVPKMRAMASAGRKLA